MDTSTTQHELEYRRDGFANQRLCVVPRPQVHAALANPATRQLTVTDAGYFPAASLHRRVRARGIPETIVILCVAGTGTVKIGDQQHALTPSTCIFIPADQPHEYQASADNPWTIWWIHVQGSSVRELTGPLLGHAQPVIRLRSVDREVALFDDIVSHLEKRLSPAHLLAASGAAWQLLTRIAVDSVLPADGSPLERAMRFVEERVDGNIRVSELASLVGMSPSHLSALFRQATGGGPGAFHTTLKMARARALLDTTSMSVAEIAATIGYTDALYFSRHFRRVHGASPTQYRAQHKG